MKFADEFDMLPEAGLVLACVSGGADSMCLLEALLEISEKRGFTVGAAHFNHRLRGGESDRDEKFVAEQCAARGVPFFSGSGDVRACAKKQGLNLEAAARELRYGFFYEAASNAGAVRIATAHTADDNTETMIFNLARGSGTAGLSGIPPKRDMLIRPMLSLSRDDVMRFIGSRGIEFVLDSTNELDVFTRNKIRHSVVPVLRGLNPGLNETTGAAAALLRADEEYLSELAEKFIARSTQRSTLGTRAVMTGELFDLPFAVSSRVIRKLHGGSLSYKHVGMLLEACAKDGPPVRFSLPGSVAYVEYGRLVFGKSPAEGFSPARIAEGETAAIPELGLKITCTPVSRVAPEEDAEVPAQENQAFQTGKNEPFSIERAIINKSFTSFLFKSVDICGKMTVRSRREGDKIRLSGHSGTKTLKKLFIERRVPARERALVPVVADDAGVLAVCGIGAGDRAAPQPGDSALRVDFEISAGEEDVYFNIRAQGAEQTPEY